MNKELNQLVESISEDIKNTPEFRHVVMEIKNQYEREHWNSSYHEDRGSKILRVEKGTETQNDAVKYIINFVAASNEVRISKFGCLNNYFLGCKELDGTVTVETFRYDMSGSNYDFEKSTKIYPRQKRCNSCL